MKKLRDRSSDLPTQLVTIIDPELLSPSFSFHHLGTLLDVCPPSAWPITCLAVNNCCLTVERGTPDSIAGGVARERKWLGLHPLEGSSTI